MAQNMTAEWCYSTDGEIYTECERARTREEAIAEARAECGLSTGLVSVARVKRFRHDDFVRGVGDRVIEWMNEQAINECGDHAEDYPQVHSSFAANIEDAIIALANGTASQPTFFQAEDTEEVDVAPKRKINSESPCALTPEEEDMKLRIEEAREAHREVTHQLGRVLGQCRHPVCGTDKYTLQPACAVCGKIMDFT